MVSQPKTALPSQTLTSIMKGNIMIIASPISPQVLNGITAMLQANIPGLTSAQLLDALKCYRGADALAGCTTPAHPEPPYTRRKAAEFLNVSLPTIDRYLASGLLKRVRITAHTVRITSESVRALIEGGTNNA